MERVGIVLLHRGEPASAQQARPFLRSVFSDPHAYSLPLWSEAQRLLAGVLSRGAARALEKRIAEAGGRSRLPSSVEALARRLEEKLNGDSAGTAAARFAVRAAYCYEGPTIEQAVEELAKDGIRRLVGLSLYPQLCRRFLESSVLKLEKAAGEARLSVVDRYGEQPEYLEALRKTLESALGRLDAGARDRAPILLCAPGIDRPALESGDPYPAQLRATLKVLGGQLPNPHRLAIGEEWARPLRELRALKCEQLVLAPLGIAVEELHSVHGLDLELRRAAKEAGFTRVERAPAVSEEASFPGALAAIVRQHLERQAALGLG